MRRVDPGIVTRVLYGAPDGMRYTQDSPVLRQVWLAYMERPEAPRDLLIVPWKDCPASELGEWLHRKVAAYRKRLPDRRAGKEADAIDARVPAHVADIPGLVTATLYFDELCSLILPQTKFWYWSHLYWLTKQPMAVQRALIAAWTTSIAKTPPGREIPDLTLMPDTGDRDGGDMVRSTAFGLALGGKRASAVQKKHEFQREDDDPFLDDPAARTAVMIAATAAEGTELVTLDDFDGEKSADGWARVFSAFQSDEPRDETALVFTVNCNRRPSAAVNHSVPTVKGDAARRLFQLDCSDIGWAVVDSGIDSEHEAFQTEDRKSHRVEEAYDMVRFREVISRDNLVNETERKALAGRLHAEGLGPKTLSETNRLVQALGRDVDMRRPTDFAKVAQLLRIRGKSQPTDPHGTHVAGILGARPWEYLGRRHEGMCPNIRLFDFRVLGDDARKTEFAIIGALRLIEHINRSSQMRRIHGANLSLSLPHDVMNYACGRTPVCEECEKLVHSGVVVVAAAGNRGYNAFATANGGAPVELHTETSITDPGNAELVITVGSTHRLEPHNYGISYFSSRGPTGDGRPKPDLVAPGEKIRAPVPGPGRYADKGGTSMAAPHVSGAAAMLMARFPELKGQPQRVKEILMASATDLKRIRDYQGAGLVDILRALQSV